MVTFTSPAPASSPLNLRSPIPAGTHCAPGVRIHLRNHIRASNSRLGLNKGNLVGIDLGLNNLATIVNNIGLPPIVVKGGGVKSTNQFYNKMNAKLQSQIDQQGHAFQTKRQQALLRWRNNKIHNFFHQASRKIVNYFINHDIGKIFVGYNQGWKQEIKLGHGPTRILCRCPLLSSCT